LATNVRLAARFGSDGKENIKCLGINGKLNEIHAAMALASIKRLDETINANKRRFEAYRSYFKDIPGLAMVKFSGYDKYNYCLTLVELTQDWPYSHDDTLSILQAEKIYARPYYSPPLHLSEHAPEECNTPSLPIMETLSYKIIQMPVGEKVKIADIKRISEFISFIYDNADHINHRLYKRGAAS
jgi:dTDP-4-amino-4,6-dideoxygalactose transaminase